ncbi:MAG: DNA repair protein RecO [Alcaligenaceae bacterium]|uniref:DNA repair protein RecO n=1 Tax=Paenalcaligenes hermetiae TaxID=1157987 RepID=A0ABP9LZG9_9BURK|nr:DNA repair protein RecO [Paenalcaligenes sp.]NLJ63200.1 DNA repair protein RecO [Alcaligenaceae bacterium]
MSKRQRVNEAASYLLHATPWKESSLIAQMFSRDYGIVSLVAKGAKRPYSALKPVLLNFQPLLLSWSGSNEVKTLTRAELAGLHPISGRALMSAWYMNELILRLLPKEDPHPNLFDQYRQALTQLAQGQLTAATILREFEWVLLQETGYGLDEAMPDFFDLEQEPVLRQRLRERIDYLLGRPLRTRTVLMELQEYGRG